MIYLFFKFWLLLFYGCLGWQNSRKLQKKSDVPPETKSPDWWMEIHRTLQGCCFWWKISTNPATIQNQLHKWHTDLSVSVWGRQSMSFSGELWRFRYGCFRCKCLNRYDPILVKIYLYVTLLDPFVDAFLF